MRIAVLFLLAGLVAGCTFTRVDRETYGPDDATVPIRESDPDDVLQAHLLGGDVIMYENWIVSETDVTGFGSRYDALRSRTAVGNLTVPLDSVAVFVADREVANMGPALGLTVVTGVSVALTAYCLSNPKSCFGSCPTFYAPDEAGEMALLAEGYSSSIAPSMRARDVDALGLRASGGAFELRMTNEALETHVTRRADLLAVPVGAGETAYFEGHGTDEGRFWRTSNEQVPLACSAPEGECTAALASADGDERTSEASATDLAEKESITLTFDAPEAGQHALVLTGRQSLLTTFLVYQGLAYAGDDIGGWISQGETRAAAGNPIPRYESGTMLGLVTDIPVEVRGADGEWVEAGVVHEVGPLARDAHLVRLPEIGPGPVEVRLRPTMGAWRLDAARLVTVEGEATPLRLSPEAVVREAHDGDPAPDTDALASLTDDTRDLVTLPGTALRLQYALPVAPEASEWTLFLEAEGYYLEWMRDEWMPERDPDALAEMLFSPEDALKRLAPMFKDMEADMEEAFWGSRFAAPSAPITPAP